MWLKVGLCKMIGMFIGTLCIIGIIGGYMGLMFGIAHCLDTKQYWYAFFTFIPWVLWTIKWFSKGKF